MDTDKELDAGRYQGSAHSLAPGLAKPLNPMGHQLTQRLQIIIVLIMRWFETEGKSKRGSANAYRSRSTSIACSLVIEFRAAR